MASQHDAKRQAQAEEKQQVRQDRPQQDQQQLDPNIKTDPKVIPNVGGIPLRKAPRM